LDFEGISKILRVCVPTFAPCEGLHGQTTFDHLEVGCPEDFDTVLVDEVPPRNGSGWTLAGTSLHIFKVHDIWKEWDIIDIMIFYGT
jgi:hypothetical protein